MGLLPERATVHYVGPHREAGGHYFEVPQDVIGQVIALNPAASFVENLREHLEDAARYRDLCR